MEPLNFTFKKSRRLSDLLQDYISLFKKIFKHFNGQILTMSLPFIAIFILITFYFSSFATEIIQTNTISSTGLFELLILLTFLFLLVFFLLISTFGIEYIFLLEEKGTTNFSSKDIFKRIKSNLVKYISFFFASIVIGLMLLIPLGIVYFVLIFIPIIGTLVLGVVSACLILFFYCALFLYLQGRENLWDSYKASFYLIKSKLFEYGVASYIFQFLVQIILGVLTLIPIVILGVIGFTSLGFNDRFFESFLGKFLFSIGGTIFFLFIIISSIYMIAFYTLQYFSLLESNYKEDTLKNIDQIGETKDEF